MDLLVPLIVNKSTQRMNTFMLWITTDLPLYSWTTKWILSVSQRWGGRELTKLAVS